RAVLPTKPSRSTGSPFAASNAQRFAERKDFATSSSGVFTRPSYPTPCYGSPAMALVLELAALPEVRVGHCGPLMVMVWRGNVTPESLAKTNEIEEALIKQHHQIAVVGVVTDLSGGVPS